MYSLPPFQSPKKNLPQPQSQSNSILRCPIEISSSFAYAPTTKKHCLKARTEKATAPPQLQGKKMAPPTWQIIIPNFKYIRIQVQQSNRKEGLANLLSLSALYNPLVVRFCLQLFVGLASQAVESFLCRLAMCWQCCRLQRGSCFLLCLFLRLFMKHYQKLSLLKTSITITIAN